MKSSCGSPHSRHEFVFSQILSLEERGPHARCSRRPCCLTERCLYLQYRNGLTCFGLTIIHKRDLKTTQKNTRQTSLEFTSLPRQKLKFHVWWSCFPYRRRNSGIVWTADGCSITTMTKGLSPEQCKHRLPRDVTSLSSFERSWV